jgi:hypothetical protein
MRLPPALRAAGAVLSALVLAYGVLVLHWPVLSIMLLFWCENVLIGGFNVVKMLSAGVQRGAAAFAVAVGTSVFFTVHYGLFTLVHGLFVLTLFSSLRDGGSYAEAEGVLREAVFGDRGFFVALAVLAALQFMEFVEWRSKPPPEKPSDLMAAPYGRIVILHLTILFGGFLIMQLGTPVAGVLLLIALKLAGDLIAVSGTRVLRKRHTVVVLSRGPRT